MSAPGVSTSDPSAPSEKTGIGLRAGASSHTFTSMVADEGPLLAILYPANDIVSPNEYLELSSWQSIATEVILSAITRGGSAAGVESVNDLVCSPTISPVTGSSMRALNSYLPPGRSARTASKSRGPYCSSTPGGSM